MLTLPPSVRIFLSTSPADMRRSFDGLALLVRDILAQDPFSGHLFLFRNRKGDRVKLLWWERGGFCLFYKRLEKGRFLFPACVEPSVRVEATDLMLLLEGVDFRKIQRPAPFDPKCLNR